MFKSQCYPDLWDYLSDHLISLGSHIQPYVQAMTNAEAKTKSLTVQHESRATK